MKVGSFRYDAFVSYAWGADSRTAAALRAGLHGFAKRTFQLRALRVFVDEASLDVSGALPTRLRDALDASRHLILLASPEAAKSDWVNEELRHWALQRGTQGLLIVVTDGLLEWSSARNDFDRSSSALPEALFGKFHEEPIHLDLRHLRRSPGTLEQDLVLGRVVARLSATIQGRNVDELVGEDIAQHRRLVQLRRAAVLITGGSIALSLALAGARQMSARRAEILALTDEVQIVLSTEPSTALEHIVEAFRLSDAKPYSLIDALDARPPRDDVYETAMTVADRTRALDAFSKPANATMLAFGAVQRIAASPAGERLAILSKGGVFLLKEDFEALRAPLTDEHGERVQGSTLAWNRAGTRFAVAGGAPSGNGPDAITGECAGRGWIRLFDAQGVELEGVLQLPADLKPIRALTFSGDTLVAADCDGRMYDEGAEHGRLSEAGVPRGRSIDLLAVANFSLISGSSEPAASAAERASSSTRSDPPVHLDRSSCLEVSPGLTDVVVACRTDGSLAIWSYLDADRRDKPQFQIRPHEAGVSAAAISSSQDLIATGGRSGEVRVSFGDGTPMAGSWRAHDGEVTALAWLGKRLLSGGSDGWIRIWDVADLAAHQVIPIDDSAVAASWQGQLLLALVQKDNAYRVVDASGNPWPSVVLPRKSQLSASAWGPGMVAAGWVEGDDMAGPFGAKSDPEVFLHRLDGGARVAQRLDGLGAPARAMAFSRDGRRLAVGFGLNLAAWQLREALKPMVEAAAQAQPPDTLSVPALSDLPGGIAFFDDSGHVLTRTAHPGARPVDVVAANAAAGPTFASSWDSESIQLWDAEGERLGAPIVVESAPDSNMKVSALTFSPDGTSLVAALGSKLLDAAVLPPAGVALPLRTLGIPTLVFIDLSARSVSQVKTTHRGSIQRIVFSSDGERLYAVEGTAHASGVVSIWTRDGRPLVAPVHRERSGLLAAHESANGDLETLDSKGGARSWPATPERIAGLLTARRDLARRDQRVRNLIESVTLSNDGAGLDRAERALNEALELDPRRADALLKRADVRARLGRLSEADRDFDRAARMTPFESLYAYRSGRWKVDRHDWVGANRDLTTAIETLDHSLPLIEGVFAAEMSQAMRSTRFSGASELYDLRAVARCGAGDVKGAFSDAQEAQRRGRQNLMIGLTANEAENAATCTRFAARARVDDFMRADLRMRTLLATPGPFQTDYRLLRGQELLDYNRLRLELATRSPKLCAAFWRADGNVMRDDVVATLATLSDADLRLWWQIQGLTRIRTIQARGRRPSERRSAQQIIQQTLPELEAMLLADVYARLLRTLAAGPSASPEEGCEALEVLMSSAPQLEPEARDDLLRALVTR